MKSKQEQNNSLKIKRDEMLSKMFIDFNKVILALAVIAPILSSTSNWIAAIIGVIAIMMFTLLAYFLIQGEKNES